ncbi:MAG: FAD:protein FMN transferase [Victivallales bacterium]|nr:FAD:protein FMN transferase [Victivallales bacterium]
MMKESISKLSVNPIGSAGLADGEGTGSFEIGSKAIKWRFAHCSPLLCLFAAVFFIGCGDGGGAGTEVLTRRYSVMGGSILDIRIYSGLDSDSQAVEMAYGKVSEVDSVCNIFDPGSELSRLNATAFEEDFECGDLLWDILMKARFFHSMSGGAFDISVAPLMDLWGFHRKRQTMPSDEDLRKIMQSVGLYKVVFDEDRRAVRFTVEGMKLDLGGIAKGYAVQLAADTLSSQGIRSGLVNLAGNVRCLDLPPPGKDAYAVGIRHPKVKDALCGAMEFNALSVATSGNYEKYVTLDGRRFTHIVNPLTGFPVEDMLSVTVVTPDAGDADALSTAVFVAGPEFAGQAAQIMPDTHILIIRSAGDQDSPEIIKIGNLWNFAKIKL